jgi:hypothetical protein
MNSIIPRGRYVELDVSSYLEENREAYGETAADDEERQNGGRGGGASNVADNPSPLPAGRVR